MTILLIDRSTTTNPESFYNGYHSTHVIYDSLQNSDKDLPCSHELKITTKAKEKEKTRLNHITSSCAR